MVVSQQPPSLPARPANLHAGTAREDVDIERIIEKSGCLQVIRSGILLIFLINWSWMHIMLICWTSTVLRWGWMHTCQPVNTIKASTTIHPTPSIRQVYTQLEECLADNDRDWRKCQVGAELAPIA